jgi:hypothetical protein
VSVNVAEGLRRLAAAIRWTGYLIGGLFVAGACIGLVNNGSGSVALFIAAIGAFAAAVGWVIAWIVDGFSKSKLQRSED